MSINLCMSSDYGILTIENYGSKLTVKWPLWLTTLSNVVRDIAETLFELGVYFDNTDCYNCIIKLLKESLEKLGYDVELQKPNEKFVEWLFDVLPDLLR